MDVQCAHAQDVNRHLEAVGVWVGVPAPYLWMCSASHLEAGEGSEAIATVPGAHAQIHGQVVRWSGI